VTVRNIVLCGDNKLRVKSEKVKKITKSVKTLITDMFDTLEAAGGIGLAAPQIGIAKAVIIIDLTKAEKDTKMVLINPVIQKKYGPKEIFAEGCLSIPEIYGDVIRHTIIDLIYENADGKLCKMKDVSGIAARVIQHEVDHLNGVLYIDLLEPEEKKKIFSDVENIIKKTKLSLLK